MRRLPHLLSTAAVRTMFVLPCILVGAVVQAQPDPSQQLSGRLAVLENDQRLMEEELQSLRKQMAELIRQLTNVEGGTSSDGVAIEQEISIDGAPVKGSEKASVLLIEYSDFQCPFCARHYRDVLPSIEREYIQPGRLRYVFRNFPIEKLHPASLGAAAASMCAHKENRFWPMHDRIFSTPNAIDSASLTRYASEIGVDPERFDRCMSSMGVEMARADTRDAKKLGVIGTPTFVIARMLPDGRIMAVRLLSGAQSFQTFQSVLAMVDKESTSAQGGQP